MATLQIASWPQMRRVQATQRAPFSRSRSRSTAFDVSLASASCGSMLILPNHGKLSEPAAELRLPFFGRSNAFS